MGAAKNSMRLGKLTNEQLERLVLSKFINTRSETVVCGEVGEDCAVLDMGGDLCVLSTDPITGAGQNIGALAVHVCCNDAAACGAEPVGLLVTLLMPPTATEEEIERIASEVSQAAVSTGVDVLGGHTEVTDAVTRPVISAAVVAKVRRGRLITSAGMKVGDDIVMTKYAGLEGTSILASDYAGRLAGRLTAEELQEAQGLCAHFGVTRESEVARSFGATAMHDATEGGVLGALWELAAASGCGVEVESAKIPVLDVTKKICAAFGLDPLRLISSGVLLIACPDGAALAARLQALGIPAAVVAKAVEGASTVDGRLLAPPEGDELNRVR